LVSAHPDKFFSDSGLPPATTGASVLLGYGAQYADGLMVHRRFPVIGTLLSAIDHYAYAQAADLAHPWRYTAAAVGAELALGANPLGAALQTVGPAAQWVRPHAAAVAHDAQAEQRARLVRSFYEDDVTAIQNAAGDDALGMEGVFEDVVPIQFRAISGVVDGVAAASAVHDNLVREAARAVADAP
jgi:hypothetical protein